MENLKLSLSSLVNPAIAGSADGVGKEVDAGVTLEEELDGVEEVVPLDPLVPDPEVEGVEGAGFVGVVGIPSTKEEEADGVFTG